MANKFPIPDLPEVFPEEDFLRDGPMRHEIIVMAVEAANKQGYPSLDRETIWSTPEHRDVIIDFLRDCRPLPIIKDLIVELQNGQPSQEA